MKADRCEAIGILAPTDYDQFPTGGTKAFLAEFLLALPREVADKTTLIGITKGDRPAKTGERRFGSNVYPFVSLGAWREPQSVRLRFLRLVWSSWGLLRELGAETLYVHNVETSALCALRGFKGRLILHCHGVDNPIRLGRFIARRGGLPIWIYDHLVLPFALGHARHVFITASKDDVTRFSERHGPGLRINQVPPLIDRVAFSPGDRSSARRALDLPDNCMVGVVVGRLEQAKGVHTVLKAIHILHEEGHQVRLLVVGDGSYRVELESLTADLGLHNSVRFCGMVDRTRLPAILAAADVYLSGSWREGFSMALVEALACGIPAVVTDAGAAGDVIVDAENGYTVPVDDPREMAARVKCVAAVREKLRERCLASVDSYRPSLVIKDMLPALGFHRTL